MLLLVSGMACTNRPADTGSRSLDFPPEVKAKQAEDSIAVVTGKLVIGHEVCSFVVDGDSAEYWFIDRSGKVQQEYERIVPEGIKSYTPVRVEMKVKYLGKSDEGFVAEHHQQLSVVEKEKK